MYQTPYDRLWLCINLLGHRTEMGVGDNSGLLQSYPKILFLHDKAHLSWVVCWSLNVLLFAMDPQQH